MHMRLGQKVANNPVLGVNQAQLQQSEQTAGYQLPLFSTPAKLQ